MNTPAHLIFGAAAFARPDARAVNFCALAGSILPDVSLYLMAANALFIKGIPAGTVFGKLYFSDEWQSVFAIDNSFFIWILILIGGLALRKYWLTVLGSAGLLHLAFDFPFHHDDGRQHFWPFSDWVFESPLSYWDVAHYGNILGPVEGIVCVALCVLLWRRFKSWQARTVIVAGGTIEFLPATFFPLLF